MNKKELLELRSEFIKDRDADLLRLDAIAIGALCESCNNKGYLEVTHKDSKEYIDACQKCYWFGRQDDADYKARVIAECDGYILDRNGVIKGDV